METNLPRHLDPIPSWKAWRRKLITIRALSDGSPKGPISQQQFLARVAEIQQRAQSTGDMAVKTASFWKMENLASYFLKQGRPATTLHDSNLPLEVRPIVHCGMGIGAVEVANFDPSRITTIINSFSNPDYRLFAHEGSGAMLSLYEPDLFGLTARGFSWLGLIPLAPLRRPPRDEFLAAFSPEIQRLIAHGYGRMLYFKSSSIAAAIEAARATQPLQVSASVQGIAFAYAMVNNSDLDRVLGAAGGLAPLMRRSFENGLIYALEFWEWMAPGSLRSLRPVTAYGRKLIGVAQREIDASRQRGVLTPFAVLGQQ